MNAARLLALADHLDTLPPKRFNFRSWVAASWDGRPLAECGAPACALGHATALWGKECGVEIRSISNAFVPAPIGSDLRYHAAYVRASELLFDLSEGATEYLFTPCDQDDPDCRGDHYNEDGSECTACADTGRPLAKASAHEVAEHIRRFVKEHTS
jgi:hypothetical protein